MPTIMTEKADFRSSIRKMRACKRVNLQTENKPTTRISLHSLIALKSWKKEHSKRGKEKVGESPKLLISMKTVLIKGSSGKSRE